MNASDTDLIRMESITRSYNIGTTCQKVLHTFSLSILSGQTCAIVGASGSGKSTLLNLIGLLDTPTSGRLLLQGRDMSRCDANARAIARNRLIGFVFQSFNLLPRLSALDNVALPLLYRGILPQTAQTVARKYLDRVGLSARIHYLPADLSGGQRQRVAIARALVGEPDLLLADEPTGNLDSQNAADIIDLLLTLNRDCGTTLVMVTHDTTVAKRMSRCIQVSDGRVSEAYHA